MTSKDYVYFGLIVFAAILFYFHGYAVGAADRRRQRKAARRSLETNVRITQIQLQDAPEPRSTQPRSQPLKPVEAVHCFFGNN